jgi:hypothetical protein
MKFGQWEAMKVLGGIFVKPLLQWGLFLFSLSLSLILFSDLGYVGDRQSLLALLDHED